MNVRVYNSSGWGKLFNGRYDGGCFGGWEGGSGRGRLVNGWYDGSCCDGYKDEGGGGRLIVEPSCLFRYVPSVRAWSSILKVNCDVGRGECDGGRFVDWGSHLLRYVPSVRHRPSILQDNLSSSWSMLSKVELIVRKSPKMAPILVQRIRNPSSSFTIIENLPKLWYQLMWDAEANNVG